MNVGRNTVKHPKAGCAGRGALPSLATVTVPHLGVLVSSYRLPASACLADPSSRSPTTSQTRRCSYTNGARMLSKVPDGSGSMPCPCAGSAVGVFALRQTIRGACRWRGILSFCAAGFGVGNKRACSKRSAQASAAQARRGATDVRVRSTRNAIHVRRTTGDL